MKIKADRKYAVWICIAALGLISAACQPGTPSVDTGPTPSPVEETALAPALRLLSLDELKLPPYICGSPRGCPSAIGELVTVTSSGLRFCTATLVAPDVVLTASHCIPWENVSRDRSVTGNCWIRWPKADPRTGLNITPCQAVIQASEMDLRNERVVQRDHAFLRLASAHPGRRLISIQEQDEPTLIRKRKVVVFGTSLQKEQHVLRRVTCRRDDSHELPGRAPLHGETIILPTCSIENGFSGGPIIDPRLKTIVGVMSFMKTVDPKAPKRPGIAVGTDAPRLP